jgi:hypothetical protein
MVKFAGVQVDVDEVAFLTGPPTETVSKNICTVLSLDPVNTTCFQTPDGKFEFARAASP